MGTGQEEGGPEGAAARLARNVGRGALAATGLGVVSIAAGSALEALGITDTNIMAFEGDPGQAATEQARRHFMAGGALGTRQRRIEREQSDAQRLTGAFADQIAQGESAQNMSQETLDSLFADRDIQDMSFQMMQGGNSAAQGLQRLADRAATETDPERKAVLDTLHANAQLEIRLGGRVSDRWGAMAASAGNIGREAAQSKRARLGTAREMTAIGNEMGRILQDHGIEQAFTRIGEQYREGWTEGNNRTQNIVTQLGNLDREQRSEIIGALGQVEGDEETRERAQALAGVVAREGAIGEQLMGRGRRGRRQAMETAMGQFGGLGRGLTLTMGEGDRQRRISGARAQRLTERFFRGGRMSEEARGAVQQALTLQMREAGLDEDQQRQLTEAIGAVGVGTEEERAAARDRVRTLRDQPEFRETFSRLNEQQTKQALANARGRDPMGRERNDLLRQIAQAPGVTTAPAEGVPPAAEGGGGGGDSGGGLMSMIGL
jgi:polyhydroxyalkanoate synthesis regulator phasin